MFETNLHVQFSQRVKVKLHKFHGYINFGFVFL